MNVSRRRDKTSYISVHTFQTHSIIQNFQSYLPTGSAKILYSIYSMCRNLNTRSNIDEKALKYLIYREQQKLNMDLTIYRGFELFVYWIFSEIGSKKLQPQENYLKDKMLKLSPSCMRARKTVTFLIRIQSRKYPGQLSLFSKENWLTLTSSPFCLFSFFLTRL